MELALQLIKENQRTQAPFLDLGYCGLTELPTELFDCTWLENLNLGTWYYDEQKQEWEETQNQGEKNRLVSLEKISLLKNLRILNFSDNQISDLSPLKGLNNLQDLAFRKNKISDLSPLKDLINLQTLWFQSNQVSDLTPLKDLINLQNLDFQNNQVYDLTPLKDLINLQKLFFSENQVSDLTPLKDLINLKILDFEKNQVYDLSSLKGLKNLQNLWFKKNEISDLSSLKDLKNLQKLSFWENKVSDLSPLKELNNLKRIWFKGNPAFDSLPADIQAKFPEAWDNQIEALQYWLDTFGGLKKVQYYREAKVVFVGEGDIGKTSLIKLLVRNSKEQTQGRTETIEIEKDTEHYRYEGEPLTVYFWDFGGQQIMQATHQFFMSRQTVYVLVVNGRKDDQNLQKWLEMIGRVGGEDSAIVLAVNKLDKPEDHHQLAWHSLQEAYPALKVLVETSWATERGIEDLRAAIQAALHNLQHLTEPIAEKYLRTKERLQALDCNYIEYKEYVRICEDEASKIGDTFEPNMIQFFSERLHNLGIMLNFGRFHNHLQHLQIFRPQWIIEGIYKIINSPDLQKAENKGKIHEDRLDEILEKIGYQVPTESNYILKMMQKFQLVYPSNPHGRETYYFVPSLFPADRPAGLDSYWESKKQPLRFQFHYISWGEEYMTYFLNHQHAAIYGDYYWRSGAILRYGTHEVLIAGNSLKKCIEIAVSGEGDARYALWKVREALEEGVHGIFSSREKLGITEWVVYQENGLEDSFSVQELKELLAMGETHKPSTKFKRRFPIRELLEGFEVPEKEQIKEYLAKGYTEKALELFMKLAKISGGEMEDEAILLSGIYQNSARKKGIGTKEYENNLDENRVNATILRFLR